MTSCVPVNNLRNGREGVGFRSMWYGRCSWGKVLCMQQRRRANVHSMAALGMTRGVQGVIALVFPR